MTSTSSKGSFLAACVLSLAAVALIAAPEEATRRIRTLVRDAILPGHRAAAWCRESLAKRVESFGIGFIAAKSSPAEDTELRAAIEREQLQSRKLRIEVATLREQLATVRKEGVSPYKSAPSESLVVSELIEATVLGNQAAALFRSGMLIDRGSAAEVAENDLIVKSEAPIIDQGSDSRVEPDQPVYAGRTVLGKVRDVGRWTSTIERVTDVGYRGHAQLGWQSPDGNVFGAEGILEGQGTDVCQLTNVPATEAVSVGDEVYTARRATTLSYPMYYGTVLEAELEPGALFWKILVKPAAAQIDMQKVQILTARRNPARPLAN